MSIVTYNQSLGVTLWKNRSWFARWTIPWCRIPQICPLWRSSFQWLIGLHDDQNQQEHAATRKMNIMVEGLRGGSVEFWWIYVIDHQMDMINKRNSDTMIGSLNVFPIEIIRGFCDLLWGQTAKKSGHVIPFLRADRALSLHSSLSVPESTHYPMRTLLLNLSSLSSFCALI